MFSTEQEMRWRSLLKKLNRIHLFNCAKAHDPAWVDPNEELMPQ